MAAVDVGARDVPPINDDIDELFNYEVDNDLFQEVDTNMDVAPKQPSARTRDGTLEGGLGLDEEIKITKKRAPISKLDESRLLSQAGIPRLRRIAKERLRFKGKGHEYSDIARLLNFYQLWLDDLYPRAKFADGLAIIEKLGHSKRMQTMRKEWINEGKVKHSTYVEQEAPSENTPINRHKENKLGELRTNNIIEDAHPSLALDANQISDSTTSPKSATINKSRSEGISADDSLFISDGEDIVDDAPEGDDLDALLAEDDAVQRTAAVPSSNRNVDISMAGRNFDDEEEAMANVDDLW